VKDIIGRISKGFQEIFFIRGASSDDVRAVVAGMSGFLKFN